MKQTNNAIKFLMAQYRAIFKNAYFKGLTSAVLLTAGLAVAGGAQAATNIDSTNWGQLTTDANGVTTVTGAMVPPAATLTLASIPAVLVLPQMLSSTLRLLANPVATWFRLAVQRFMSPVLTPLSN